MSNNSTVKSLGNEFTRYIASSEGREFYFSETSDEKAIKVALAHFPEGNVGLGLQDTPDSLYDISDLREVVDAEQVLDEHSEVVEVAKKRGRRNPPRNSNHGPRQAAYFGL